MKKTFFLLLFCACLNVSLVPCSSFAQQYKEISAPVVKNMLENENVLVINLLSRLEYDLHHINGSINIPINTLEGSPLLPADLTTPLIFYCMGFR